MSVAVLRMGYTEVVSIQSGGKLDYVIRCLAKTSYVISRWDVATAAERCSLSHRQKHRNYHRENVQLIEPNNFVHRIARNWNRLTAIWGALQQTACQKLPSSKFLLSWQNKERAFLSKHGRNRKRTAQSFIDKSVGERRRRRLECVVRQNGGHIEQMFN